MDADEQTSTYTSMRRAGVGMTAEERRQLRQQKKQKEEGQRKAGSAGGAERAADDSVSDGRIAEMLSRNEDEMLNFVAQINNLYQECLKKPAPFMTFVLCGMQSAGKSTIMERFMNAVLNIIQEGTGTRCPLDTTCIHDSSCTEPKCELKGNELSSGGENLSIDQVFEQITSHNVMLGKEDRFSTEPLRLVFRAKNVSNMRFVDTPGIISNKSTGKDNREDIKTILRSEMRKPNTKLCILLEPKEFATNPIVEFCDESFGGRDKWIEDATFMMTKFDKQLDDSRTGSKANNFFKEFHKNNCFPHLVITPTLPKEDLPAEELFEARRELLDSSECFEKEKFTAWREGHDLFKHEHGGNDEILNENIQARIGFLSAKKVMREIMLEDTARRLPEVLAELRKELAICQKREKVLEDKRRFNDPKELKSVVAGVLWYVEKRILSYLDGDLESALKFPEMLQTLGEEIDDEEDSEWSQRELNHFSEAEDRWRDKIASMDSYPVEVQADNKFLGGKQVHRAIEFFRAVMIDSLPDPYQLRDKVPNGTGYLGGGLQRENWERAMVQITRVCVKDVSHPGINYLIKHVGTIFRRLFGLALDDIKQGEQFSATFKLLPTAVERFLVSEFDEMLWKLMLNVAEKTHCSLEPMYSTVDPNLPTFHPNRFDSKDDDEELYVCKNGEYERLPSTKQKEEESWMKAATKRLTAIVSGTGEETKQHLKLENNARATKKAHFLPDERTSMITSDETDKILRRSFEYIVALMEFNLVTLKFQLNHYLYEEFKNELSRSFSTNVLNDAEWDTLVEPDMALEQELANLKEQIVGLADSLKDVQRMQRRM